jgi:3D (Asp-Asp-Asp) domain-containing protein
MTNENIGGAIVIAGALALMIGAIAFFGPPPEKATTEEVSTIDARVAHLEKQVDRLHTLVGEVFKITIDEDFTIYSTPVTVTAYTAREEECNSEPWITADGTPSRIGLLAVSRDILTELNLKYGQRVLLQDYGVFEIRDTMNKRWRRRVDILHADPESARRFGKKDTVLTWIGV